MHVMFKCEVCSSHLYYSYSGTEYLDTFDIVYCPICKRHMGIYFLSYTNQSKLNSYKSSTCFITLVYLQALKITGKRNLLFKHIDLSTLSASDILEVYTLVKDINFE